jgi:transcriptional regulator with XRE-family HTH domain
MVANQLGDFLRTRRARVSPVDAGIASLSRRRVTGLRREDVAYLAGVSQDYYARLEQGRQATPSPDVLDALAGALRLDGDERAHLFALAGRPAPWPGGPPAHPRERAARLVRAYGETPAMAVGPYLDLVALNDAADLLFPGLSAHHNVATWLFLEEPARRLYADQWRQAVAEVAGMLRFEAGRYGQTPRLANLLSELGAGSGLFAELWSEQGVSSWQLFDLTLHHPARGPLRLSTDMVSVVGTDITICVLMPVEQR